MIPTQLILKEKIQRRGQKEKYRKQRLSSIVILASFVVVLFVVVQVWTWNTLIAQRDPQDNVMFWKKDDSSAAQPKQLPNNPRILQPQDTITANDSNYHPPLRRTQQQLKQELEIFQDLPILIIGGTDGSGTRAVVDALRKLGTPIVSDDPSTFDVHGKEMFRGQGWPALVELILSHTHGSGNFEWDDLPSKVQHTVVGEITILLKCWDKRYQNMMEIVDLQRVQHPGMEHFPLFSGPQIFAKQRPTKVKYAIKAPVSMLLLPILTKFMGKIKFLHVLRE